MKSLRALEKLLHDRLYRERFTAVCVPSEHQEQFKTWATSLSSLRWQVVTEFCAEAVWPRLSITLSILTVHQVRFSDSVINGLVRLSGNIINPHLI